MSLFFKTAYTQPSATLNVMVIAGPTTCKWNDNTAADVTGLVRPMIRSSENNGFLPGLQSETTYRSIIFSSYESADLNLRPKLVIVYRLQLLNQ